MIFNKKKNNVPEDLPVNKGSDKAAEKSDSNYMAVADLEAHKKAEEKLNEYAKTGVINPEDFPKGVTPNTATGKHPNVVGKKSESPKEKHVSATPSRIEKSLSTSALKSIKELVDFGAIKVDPRGRTLITGGKGGSFKILFIPVDGRISVKTSFNDNWLVYDQNYNHKMYQELADHIGNRLGEVVECVMNDTVKLAELTKKKEEIKKIEKKHSEAVTDMYGFDPTNLIFEFDFNDRRGKFDQDGNYMIYDKKSGDLVDWGNILKEIEEGAKEDKEDKESE